MMDFLSVRMILQSSLYGAGAASGMVSAGAGTDGFKGAAAEDVFLPAFGFLGAASGLVSLENSGSSSCGLCRHAGVCSLALQGFSLLLSGWRV